MTYKSLRLSVLFAAIAGTALAQTHISGTCKGGKADSTQSIEVGDRPGHVLMIEKATCTWTVPVKIGGMKSTTATTTSAIEVTGVRFVDRGYVVFSMENGDKVYVRFQGMGIMKEAGPTGEGTWSYTGGTGKLKGLKGKGTFTAFETSDAGGFQMEGEYSLAGPSNTTKK